MKFSEIVKQASALLKGKGQASYRMLKREFDLNDETLEDLKAELIEVDRLAIDQDGKMLVWVGNTEEDKGIKEDTENQDASRWTPPHLAERIRATVMHRR